MTLALGGGSMAIRLAPTLRLEGPVAQGHIINSEGIIDKPAWAKRAAWCDYYGPLEGQWVTANVQRDGWLETGDLGFDVGCHEVRDRSSSLEQRLLVDADNSQLSRPVDNHLGFSTGDDPHLDPCPLHHLDAMPVLDVEKLGFHAI